MAIANCKRCGRIFNRTRRDLCPSCAAEEDQMYHRVRDYLRNHRDARLPDVAAATGVEADLIISMIRSGRLLLRDHPNLYYACERCGGPTRAGRYCPSCSRELSSVVSSGGVEAAPRSKSQKCSQDRSSLS